VSLESDIRITPDWFWGWVLEFAGDRPICDVCTPSDNPLKARRYFDEQADGLRSTWGLTLREMFREVYWCNPPYSAGNVQRWAEKAVREARRGLEVLVLTQLDASTGWYRFLRDHADARAHVSRRVGFLEPNGRGGYRPCPGGAKFASQVAYFGPRRRRFARVFGGERGEILHGLGPAEE
jgi:hypothetical protein